MSQDGFPPGFFDRVDDSPDPAFYSWPRLVTHIDDAAVDAVGRLYQELAITGNVLDLMGSWVSHFRFPPARLTVLGMNTARAQCERACCHQDRARPQFRPEAPLRRRLLRCCRVLRVRRLPDPPGRGVRRGGSSPTSPGALRLHVLEPMLPDQGHSRLAVRQRRGALRHRRAILPPRTRMGGTAVRAAHPARAPGRSPDGGVGLSPIGVGQPTSERVAFHGLSRARR